MSLEPQGAEAQCRIEWLELQSAISVRLLCFRRAYCRLARPECREQNRDLQLPPW